MSAEWNDEQKRQVQRLPLFGSDFDFSCHLVLEVEDASSARNMGVQGRKRAVEHFTIERSTQKLMDVCERVIGRASASA